MNDQTLKRFAKLPMKAQTPNRRSDDDAERERNARVVLNYLDIDLSDAESAAVRNSLVLGEPQPGSDRTTDKVLNGLISRASIRHRWSPMLSLPCR